jgi:hypothetical protein
LRGGGIGTGARMRSTLGRSAERDSTAHPVIATTAPPRAGDCSGAVQASSRTAPEAANTVSSFMGRTSTGAAKRCASSLSLALSSPIRGLAALNEHATCTGVELTSRLGLPPRRRGHAHDPQGACWLAPKDKSCPQTRCSRCQAGSRRVARCWRFRGQGPNVDRAAGSRPVPPGPKEMSRDRLSQITVHMNNS